MAKNEITLPVPTPGNVWRLVPVSLTVHVHGAGEVKTDYPLNFDPDKPDSISDALLASGLRQGFVRYIGTATTSAQEGETPKAACDRRFAEIVAGTYKPGQGGGARIDTYTVVLREFVVTVLVNNLHLKKGEAVKAAKEDSATAYRLACDKVAESIDGQDGESVFNVMWPKIEASAKTEADRRDATVELKFDLDNFAPNAS